MTMMKRAAKRIVVTMMNKPASTMAEEGLHLYSPRVCVCVAFGVAEKGICSYGYVVGGMELE